MSSTEVLLSWNEHHGSLISVFEKLLETNSLVDCTLAAEGQYLKAHRIILSACSPYFELLFNQENEKNPIVVLKDVKFQELKAIIDFVYHGNVKVPEERLSDFVQVAESLQIKGLGGDPKKNVSAASSEVHGRVRKKRRHLPSARKRRRSSDISSDEESIIDLPQVTDKNNETSPQPTSLLQQALLSPFPTPPQPEVSSSPLSAATSACELALTAQIEARRIKTEPCPSTVQDTELSTETLPDVETVVKTELEPIAQIFLPETECPDEPKSRLCVEMSSSVCWEEGEEEADVPMHDDESLSQHSGEESSFDTLTQPAMQPKLESSDESEADPIAAPNTSDSCCVLEPLVVLRPESDAVVHIESDSDPVADAAAPTPTPTPTPSPCRNARRVRTCPECEKVFTTPFLLEVHLRKFPGGACKAQRAALPKRSFPCDECSRAFFVRRHLQMHKRAHQRVRSYWAPS